MEQRLFPIFLYYHPQATRFSDSSSFHIDIKLYLYIYIYKQTTFDDIYAYCINVIKRCFVMSFDDDISQLVKTYART